MNMNKVKNIIVTGSNKGIGYGLVKYLAKSKNWNIIMAVRNIDLGKKAKNEILETYPQAKIKLEVLDISNPKSV
jgi:WW domain-containing oxidoreductase